MKKIIKYMVLFLAMVISVAGCDNSEEVIKQISPDNDVIAFFEEHLPPYSGAESDCFFVDIDHQKSICVLINSVEEFRNNFSCSSTMLTEIDFKSHTLVIGQYYPIRESSCKVINQELVVKSKEIELNLYVTNPESSFPAETRMYYWGIYPKLRNKPINVNIIY
jgi:hypothetical protein